MLQLSNNWHRPSVYKKLYHFCEPLLQSEYLFDLARTVSLCSCKNFTYIFCLTFKTLMKHNELTAVPKPSILPLWEVIRDSTLMWAGTGPHFSRVSAGAASSAQDPINYWQSQLVSEFFKPAAFMLPVVTLSRALTRFCCLCSRKKKSQWDKEEEGSGGGRGLVPSQAKMSAR